MMMGYWPVFWPEPNSKPAFGTSLNGKTGVTTAKHINLTVLFAIIWENYSKTLLCLVVLSVCAYVCMDVCVCSVRLDVGWCLQVVEPDGDVLAVTSSAQRHWSDGVARCSAPAYQSPIADSWSRQLWPGIHWLSVLLSHPAHCQLSWQYQVSQSLCDLSVCLSVPATWKTWRSRRFWKWSDKSRGKCVLGDGMLQC